MGYASFAVFLCFLLLVWFSPPLPAAEESVEEEVRRKGLWPILCTEETDTWRQFSFRPFYVSREAKDESEKRVQFLYPIYLYKRDEHDVTVRLFPLFSHRKDVYDYEEGVEVETESMLFPVLFWGDSTEEGSYLAVFPIAGTLNHFLGRDEVRFYLFPLYMDYTKDELHQRNYLWPIVSISKGGDYDGFRLWPLFGHFEKQGEYRREFVMWPIYHHQLFDLDKEQSGERMLVLPFYAREESARRNYRSVLWPFFSHEDNFAKNYEERWMPWPFIATTRGDAYRTRVWPFYGYTRTEGAEKRFVLWPFWNRNIIELEEDIERRETYLVPVWSSKSDVSESKGVIRHKHKFWPLWKFRRTEDGTTYFRMLSLFWFDDAIGFERQYSPLWTIYERETTVEGDSRTYALWRLYRHEEKGKAFETHIPLLYTSTADMAQNTRNMKILGGLFGLSRTEAESTLQVLYFIRLSY
ncbi:MAG: hypothetical protein Kow0099_38920 [Candidatus Abyssubacteria bacterium]